MFSKETLVLLQGGLNKVASAHSSLRPHCTLPPIPQEYIVMLVTASVGVAMRASNRPTVCQPPSLSLALAKPEICHLCHLISGMAMQGWILSVIAFCHRFLHSDEIVMENLPNYLPPPSILGNMILFFQRSKQSFSWEVFPLCKKSITFSERAAQI